MSVIKLYSPYNNYDHFINVFMGVIGLQKLNEFDHNINNASLVYY